MQTSLPESIRSTPQGQEADAILRRCVHCGFCLATCPTYQLLGDELDSPRGRIYLIKQMLEGEPVSDKTQLHLDRCLTCRACETTCPSGVEYGKLLDIGREITEQRVPRTWLGRLMRRALRAIAAYPNRFRALVRISRPFRFFLPPRFRMPAPVSKGAAAWPAARHARRMLILEGCVQAAVQPQINEAAARVFDRLAISIVRAPGAGCCGSISHHMAANEEARDHARRNIDAWWPEIEAGAEAIVITASGCVSTIREYGRLLSEDPAYAVKAARVSEMAWDVSEVLTKEADALGAAVNRNAQERIAFHSPCSLQHGLRLNGVVEKLLAQAGFVLTAVPDAHLCCGSAGTYSILQPELSSRLLQNKVRSLELGQPEVIATANIGCLLHIQSATNVPVRHWIELLAERLN